MGLRLSKLMPLLQRSAAQRDVLFLAAIPALSLLASSLGGQGWLLAAALFLPLGLLFLRILHVAPQRAVISEKPITNSPHIFTSNVANHLTKAHQNGVEIVCFIVGIDRFTDIKDRYGSSAADDILRTILHRLKTTFRTSDVVTRISNDRVAICIAPAGNLENCQQLARRIQSTTEEPIPLFNASVFLSCSVGFCLTTQGFQETADGFVASADIALSEALRAGPSTIRAYSAALQHHISHRNRLETEAAGALANGQIMAWFQPQVSTDTGLVTGFEALARWIHPTQGVLPPSAFLQVLHRTGQMEALVDRMIEQSTDALHHWDKNGIHVQHVGVNFSEDNLKNPNLANKLQWALDRRNLSPDRICVEILETVISDPADDTIVRNVNRLAAMGCTIDLDDFGQGHAAMSSLRQFAVSRLKIDRSYVSKVDLDPEQQRLISAIVVMADRLGLETLAEGVETAGEHALVAQLGCRYVQGYGIARPMPLAKTTSWMVKHHHRLQTPPQIGRKLG